MNSFLQTPPGKAFAPTDPSRADAGADGPPTSHRARGKIRKLPDPTFLCLSQATTWEIVETGGIVLFPTTS